ncbi:hypothetical protein GKE82_02035 [Conexibacter sp. W3-3-2]|uniref:hypothetical protein n=1 Tax=Conexibacter sp. W3-3-2 TaxID=2675227 RepID=UPI0012B8F63B|nr:hypothetical protein [Conexibacter sp. W3-3-2]MTD43116.1 hypothetical protein [Conexibacter sp. W3-3-2]
MGMLTWVTMGLALWHFTVFVPDRFAGGIIGALIGSVAGAAVFGVLLHGFSVPGRNDTDLLTAAEAIPGAFIGLAITYALGLRTEDVEPEPEPLAP